VLGSSQILTASLPKAQIVVGLSWRNLGAALGEDGVDKRKWPCSSRRRNRIAKRTAK